MVSAIDENYRGCHSYELAGGQKKAESDKKKRRKNEKRDLDNWRRQTEMGLNENYEAKTWDNWCKLESCQSSRELAELEKDTNWETCSTSRHQWRPIPINFSQKKFLAMKTNLQKHSSQKQWNNYFFWICQLGSHLKGVSSCIWANIPHRQIPFSPPQMQNAPLQSHLQSNT